MKYHLLIQTGSIPTASGPREFDTPPAIGTHLTETIDGHRLNLEVVGHHQLPVIPGGTFKHDEMWILCRQSAA